VRDRTRCGLVHQEEILRGTVKVALLPIPGVDDREIEPRISVARFLEIVRPSPVPPYNRAVDASPCRKGRNNLLRTCFSIPIPVSSMKKVTSMASSPPCNRFTGLEETVIFTVPCVVNFRAFVRRFERTCLIRPGSPSTSSVKVCHAIL